MTAHERVHGSVDLARGPHEPLALGGLGDVGGHGVGGAAGRPDGRHGGLERAIQGMVTLAQGARGAHHAPTLHGEEPRDLRPDAAARARDQDGLSIQPSHGMPSQIVGLFPGAVPGAMLAQPDGPMASMADAEETYASAGA